MVCGLGVDEANWNKKVPHERFTHMAVFLDGRIVVVGGIYKAIYRGQDEISFKNLAKNVIWTYRVDTLQWENFVISIDQTIPPGSIYSSLTAIGRHIYLFGDQAKVNLSHQVTNFMWKLSGTAQHGFKWNEIKNKEDRHAPSPRLKHGAWAYKGKLWIFGGKGMPLDGYLNDANAEFKHCNEYIPGSLGYNNQLLCFSPSIQKWRSPKCHGDVPSPHMGMFVTQFGDKIWNCRMDLTRNRNGLWELNM